MLVEEYLVVKARAGSLYVQRWCMGWVAAIEQAPQRRTIATKDSLASIDSLVALGMNFLQARINTKMV